MEIKRFIIGFWQTNCYLLISGNEMVVIDPGPGIKNLLKEIKKSKAKLKYIINTHYHLDHTFSNKILKKETGAEILIHEGEKKFIKFMRVKPNRFLKDGDEIKIGDVILKVIHTPGHTKGSICLLGDGFTPHQQKVSDISDVKTSTMLWVSSTGGAGFIFTGDTLFKDALPVTHFPGGSEKDLKNSFEKLKKILKPGVIVYPGHNQIFECTETFFGLMRY
jgi:glyoxylase-like metal-dependent hydrolase (beta-lactamase superfamily II)